jgi:pyridoxamine 5'-phosphate oxidase
MKLEDWRVSYNRDRLEREDLRDDPFAQFTDWINQASAEKILEPNAMSLATVGADGRPTIRTVLLKSFDERGFVFYTNLESRKARQIGENANVSLLFTWLPLQRQVAVNGQAEKVPAHEVLAYFLKRPFGSQLAAWSSPQSKVITTRSILEMKWEETKRKFQEGHVPLPSFWGGFRVVPRDVEFWQGRENRLHDRFLYSRQPDGKWQIDRLAP